MTDAVRPAFWLRCVSAALTAWCTFWGTFGAAMTVVWYVVLLDWVELEEPGETAGYVYLGLLTLCAGVLSLFTIRWQWVGMARSPARDHRRLLVVLVLLGIALAPQPFVYVSF